MNDVSRPFFLRRFNNDQRERHGNLREEEKRGFMRAITVQDFNPSLRIFVEAPTHGMKQRLVKVRKLLDLKDLLEFSKAWMCCSVPRHPQTIPSLVCYCCRWASIRLELFARARSTPGC